MRTGAKIGTALVGGYLLGRTSKAMPPLGLGTLLAGRRPDLDLRGLAATAAHTRHTATQALNDRAHHLADGLQERTRRLRDRAGSAAGHTSADADSDDGEHPRADLGEDDEDVGTARAPEDADDLVYEEDFDEDGTPEEAEEPTGDASTRAGG